jgi:fibronectin-binding autotransporter adhesin
MSTKIVLLAIIITAGSFFASTASAQSVYTWNGSQDSDWTESWNWDGDVGATNGTYNARLNVYGGTLIYTSALGSTTYAASGGTTYGRGLVMGGTSTMEIQGGSFSTAGSGSDILALNEGTSTLTINGGNFTSGTAGLSLGWSGGGNSILNVESGTATVSTITVGAASGRTASVNLTGGTLAVNGFATGSGTSTILLDGGTLQARQNNASFIGSGLNSLLVGGDGAIIDTNGYNITIAKGLTPAAASTGGLTTNGEGILTLLGINTYTGHTAINAGTLSIASTDSLPGWDTAGRYSVAAGAALAVGNSVADADIAAIAGTGNFSAGSSIGFDTRDGGRSFSGGLTGSLGMVKAGANTLTLTGSNSHSGDTDVLAGVLALEHGSALGSGSVSVNDGTRIELSGGVTVAGVGATTLAGNGGNYYGALHSASGDNSWSGSIHLEQDARVGGSADAILRLSGRITGTSFMARSGDTGTIIEFSNDSNDFDELRIFNPTIRLAGGDNRLPVDSSVVFDSTGNLDLGGNDQILAGLSSSVSATRIVGNSSTTSDSVLTITGTSTFGGRLRDSISDGTRTTGLTVVNGAVFTLSNNQNDFTGDATIESGSVLNIAGSTGQLSGGGTIANEGVLRFAQTTGIGTDMYMDKLISGTGSVEIAPTSVAINVFTAENTYSGGTTIDAFAVRLGGSSQMLGSEIVSGPLGTGLISVIDGQITPNDSENERTLHNPITVNNELRLGSTVALAKMTLAGDISGDGNVMINSGGVVELSGSNTHSGGTTVGAGTLDLTGSLTSAVTVDSGATLSGTGILGGGATINSGATLSPGASPGEMTLGGDLTLDGADLAIDIWGDGGGGSDHDLVTFSAGSLILSSSPTITVDLNGFDPALGRSYTIISGFSEMSGVWDEVVDVLNKPLNWDSSGKSFRIDTGSVMLTVIPEPNTLGLLLVIAAAALLRRLRI